MGDAALGETDAVGPALMAVPDDEQPARLAQTSTVAMAALNRPWSSVTR
jgi:hypothetical protein